MVGSPLLMSWPALGILRLFGIAILESVKCYLSDA